MSSNPYESPAPIEATPMPPQLPAAIVPFESGHRRAVVAKVLLGFNILVSCLAALSYWMQISLLEQAKVGQASEEALMMNDARVGLIALAELAILISTAVVFLMWFHRVYRNLPALGAAGLRFTPGWVVGYWFIPFANLVRPVQAAGEMFRGSDPALNETWGTAWQRRPGSVLVGSWWAIWLISNIYDNFSMRISLATESIESLISSSWLSIVGAALNILAALLAIAMITSIDRRQEVKYEQRFRQGQPVAVELTTG